MRFDEFGYPTNVKKICVQRECDNADCENMTFWRYDLSRGDNRRVFFAVCSSECLAQILEPRQQALRQIEKAIGKYD